MNRITSRLNSVNFSPNQKLKTIFLNFLMKVFTIQEPQTAEVPLLLSIPHSGTQFPLDIENNFDDRLRTYLDDTDWYVDRLYDFAPSLGITVIQANLSRWVVDLNRDAKNAPLYTDGRIITSCTPSTDFFGNELYKSKDLIPNEKEIEQRITDYYAPYHQKLQAIISAKKEKFGKVLLWDAHSIRHKVSTIQKAIFPDMILGDNDLTTAHPKLIETTTKFW